MNEKIIDEVMAMVSEYGGRCWTNDSVVGMEDAIRAKLREVLERTPLTDEQMDALWGGENVSLPQKINRRAISRSIERAHGIGS